MATDQDCQFFTTIDLIKNKDPYILIVDGQREIMMITAISLKTGKEITKFPFNTVKMIEENIDTLFRGDLKGVVLTLCHLKLPAFSNQYEVIKAIKELFENKKIPVFNCTKKRFVNTMCLVAANVKVNLGDTILIVMTNAESLTISQFLFTEDGYKIFEDNAFMIPTNPEALQMLALSTSKTKAKRIILASMSFGLDIPESMKKIFVTDKTIIVDRQKYIIESCLATYNWFIHRYDLKYSILPTCEYKFQFGFKFDGRLYPLVIVKKQDFLPFSQTLNLPRSAFVFYIGYDDHFTDKMEYTNLISMKNAAHRREISFTLNEQHLPEYTAKPIILDPIKSLPETLIHGQKELPVIAFFDNSSVICVWNDKKEEYEFLDTWNGMYGFELLVGFNNEKPSYGNEAVATMRSKPTYVISDLLTIISKSKKKPFHPYGFQITKDDDHPILLECDTFDGVRKAVSPGFLLAMLLKEHKRLIKEKTKIKPSKIGFCLPMMKEESSKKEKMILTKAIEEAFKLVNVEPFYIDI